DFPDRGVNEKFLTDFECWHGAEAPGGLDDLLVVAGLLVDIHLDIVDTGLFHLTLEAAAVAAPGGGVHRHFGGGFVHICHFVEDNEPLLTGIPPEARSQTPMRSVVYDGSGGVRVDDV